jgi:hypothetical protein
MLRIVRSFIFISARKFASGASENKTPVLTHQGFFFCRGEKIIFYGYMADIQL